VRVVLPFPARDRLSVHIRLKPGRAAERLGLTVRQVQRLVNRCRDSGVSGLGSRKRSRQGKRWLDEGLAQRALAIIGERCADFTDAGLRQTVGISWHPAGQGERSGT